MLAAVERVHSLGEHRPLSAIDRLGNWLSIRKLNGRLGTADGKRIGDFGSGYAAVVSRQFGAGAASITVIDVSLSPELAEVANLTPIEGRLPDAVGAIPDASLDIALCVSVLEHLTEPERMLSELRRVLAPGGTLFVNVPSWLGKRALEFSAFRLGFSPPEEMDDHKTYYDPRDLWPLLVRAGFMPHGITCRRHKFGLNTYATCKVDG